MTSQSLTAHGEKLNGITARAEGCGEPGWGCSHRIISVGKDLQDRPVQPWGLIHQFLWGNWAHWGIQGESRGTSLGARGCCTRAAAQRAQAHPGTLKLLFERAVSTVHKKQAVSASDFSYNQHRPVEFQSLPFPALTETLSGQFYSSAKRNNSEILSGCLT